MKKDATLIFPHQLFENSPVLEHKAPIYLIEEYLFFKQYKFHKQKIAFHRASMKCYEAYLLSKNYEVIYIEATDDLCYISTLIEQLSKEGVHHLNYMEVSDYWLRQRIEESSKKQHITLTVFDSPLFINNKEDLNHFFKKDKKSFHQTTFYKQERKRLGILMDKNDEPMGGKWTYDTENRKKYPAKKTPPAIHFPEVTTYHKEAKEYVDTHFSDHYGALTKEVYYPIDFEASKVWFDQFLEQRFSEFGIYEDAIVGENSILNHSVLTPMLNVGLLTPHLIIDTTLAYAEKHDIPINSLEGFVRQIIGWREFMRGMYELKGVHQRTRNFWGFTRKIPKSFYTGTTGVVPIDTTIKKILKTGYCHHIERLMVLGNFMLLCEFDPEEVYKWFMELFIDSYDWVMVPNVYGMSQFADGGSFATKPYISGSNYVMKMSNYGKGDWQQSWDGLFWRFMHEHRDFFKGNPRLKMLLSTFDRMDDAKKESHLKHAVKFLIGLK